MSPQPSSRAAIAGNSLFRSGVTVKIALMIPGMVGKNIGEWIKEGTLPKTVSKFGTKVDEIFVSYEELKAKFGKDVDKLGTVEQAELYRKVGVAFGDIE